MMVAEPTMQKVSLSANHLLTKYMDCRRACTAMYKTYDQAGRKTSLSSCQTGRKTSLSSCHTAMYKLLIKLEERPLCLHVKLEERPLCLLVILTYIFNMVGDSGFNLMRLVRHGEKLKCVLEFLHRKHRPNKID